jgi:hypothetical protein
MDKYKNNGNRTKKTHSTRFRARSIPSHTDRATSQIRGMERRALDRHTGRLGFGSKGGGVTSNRGIGVYDMAIVVWVTMRHKIANLSGGEKDDVEKRSSPQAGRM